MCGFKHSPRAGSWTHTFLEMFSFSLSPHFTLSLCSSSPPSLPLYLFLTSLPLSASLPVCSSLSLSVPLSPTISPSLSLCLSLYLFFLMIFTSLSVYFSISLSPPSPSPSLSSSLHFSLSLFPRPCLSDSHGTAISASLSLPPFSLPLPFSSQLCCGFPLTWGLATSCWRTGRQAGAMGD